MSQFFSSGGQSIWVWGLSKNQKHGQLKLGRYYEWSSTAMAWKAVAVLSYSACFNSFL